MRKIIVDLIARQAGVTKRTLHDHLTSKDELLAAKGVKSVDWPVQHIHLRVLAGCQKREFRDTWCHGSCGDRPCR
ncbi:MAG TPA: helix-turn-helix domain-containing protein [Bradyrhizobium sp.]|nr:helix-turn-helix domain-containing protein [Bradyrhizobium sp.]